MERMLSDKERQAMVDDDQKTIRQLRSCIRRNGMHPVNQRKKDRRVALFSFVSPEMDRRSGYDRRRD